MVKIINKESSGQVFVLLKVIPKTDDFFMCLSMRAKYSLGIDTVTTDIMKEGKVLLTAFGDDIAEKSPGLFNLVKDDINLDKNDRFILFRFVKVRKTSLKNGFLKYGLWEGPNNSIRYEKTFIFKKEDII